MRISFPYRAEPSSIFEVVKRPMAEVSFWSDEKKRWLNYTMIVDTGADYTLLPYSAAEDLGIDLEKESKAYKTFGIGGSETVYLINNFKIKLGDISLNIPVGFLSRDDIPPLLGRQNCLDELDVRFFRYITFFSK